MLEVEDTLHNPSCYSRSGFFGSYTTLISMTVCMVWNQRDISSCLSSLGKGSHWLNTIWLALISSSSILSLLRSLTYSHIPFPRGMWGRFSATALSTQRMGVDTMVLYGAGARSGKKKDIKVKNNTYLQPDAKFTSIQISCNCMELFLWTTLFTQYQINHCECDCKYIYTVFV